MNNANRRTKLIEGFQALSIATVESMIKEKDEGNIGIVVDAVPRVNRNNMFSN